MTRTNANSKRPGLIEYFMRGSHRAPRPLAQKIWITALLLGVFSLLRWAANPLVVRPTAYVFYLPPIVLATALCGPRWGYAAAAGSVALTLFFWMPPQLSFRVAKEEDLADVVVWAIVSYFIVYTLSALDTAAARLARQADELTDKSRALEAQTAALEESQAKLRSYAVDLERLVAERTVKLNEALAELQSFSYTVSHDLRSPLRAMQGFSHLAFEESGAALSPRAAGYLRRIDLAAQRMDDLIHDLLLFTRAGKFDALPESLDLNAVVAEVILRNPRWAERGAVFEIAGSLLPVRGVRPALTQCLANLLDNAVKFSAGGRVPKVRIWTERQGHQVRTHIADNGVGMQPVFLVHLFKPFHRGHADAGYVGRGIGLAVAKKNIVAMGGDIGVSTEPGRGTLFWFDLPSADTSR